MQTESFNPYAAPTTPPGELQLAADTEFLFNDKCVAGVGTITLPKICVVSGSRDDLVSRVTRLAWCSRWITWPRNAGIFAIIFYGGPLFALGGGYPHTMWYRLIGTGIFSVAVVATLASRLAGTAITVHWSLSRRIHQRHRWLRSLLTVFSALLCIGMFRLIAAPSGSIFPVIPGLIAIIACVSLFRGKRVMYLAGRHEGLFLIDGLSDKFLQETRRLADEHSARTGE